MFKTIKKTAVFYFYLLSLPEQKDRDMLETEKIDRY